MWIIMNELLCKYSGFFSSTLGLGPGALELGKLAKKQEILEFDSNIHLDKREVFLRY